MSENTSHLTHPKNDSDKAAEAVVGQAPTLPGLGVNLALARTLQVPATPSPSPRPASKPTPKVESAGSATPSELLLVAVPGTIPGPLQNWDRYEILRPIGQGGMGTVFLARDRRLGRLVALKFLRLPSPDANERMLQEARSQARLDHPGICKMSAAPKTATGWQNFGGL